MIAEVTAGFTGVGKTTHVNKQIENTGLQPFIFDPNREYIDKWGAECCFVGTVKDFLAKAKKQENKVIVIEEATIFFKQQGISEDAMSLNVLKRHMGKPYGCYIIWNFHSLRKIPIDILDLVNYLTIFKTNDTEDRVRKKFGDEWNVLDAFLHVRDSDNPHERVTLELQPPPKVKY